MSAPHERHYVRFFSPGTFGAEQSVREVSSWDTREAVRVASDVVERYGARPYAFLFETRLVAEPISDGCGGEMEVHPKVVRESGRHFMDGEVLTLAEVKTRLPNERILISNMEGNGYERIVRGPVKGNGWSWTQPFCENDKLVDESGEKAWTP